MKTLKFAILGIAMLVFNFSFSQSTYAVVDYMKVKPEMGQQYLAIEKAWKGIHQKRIDNGSIVGWYLYEIAPGGTKAKYDYVTVTVYENWDKLGASMERGSWRELIASLSAEEKEAFEDASKTRDMVSTQIFRLRAGVFRSPEKGKGPAKYNLVNYMKVPQGKMMDYAKMENEVFKPVHQEAVNQGKRAGWGLYSRALPYGNGHWYNAVTVDFYDSWAQMNEDNSEIFKKVHPDKKQEDIWKMIPESRTLIKGELNILVDYVEKSPE